MLKQSSALHVDCFNEYGHKPAISIILSRTCVATPQAIMKRWLSRFRKWLFARASHLEQFRTYWPTYPVLSRNCGRAWNWQSGSSSIIRITQPFACQGSRRLSAAKRVYAHRSKYGRSVGAREVIYLCSSFAWGRWCPTGVRAEPDRGRATPARRR